MTLIEARELLVSKLPGTTICVSADCWYFGRLSAVRAATEYSVNVQENGKSIFHEQGHTLKAVVQSAIAVFGVGPPQPEPVVGEEQ